MMKINYFCINLLVIVGLSLAEVPSYMRVCGRRNPNLNQCVRDSVEALRGKIAEGIPELDVPSSEPFHLEEGVPLVDSPEIRAIAQNLDVTGFKSFKPTTINVDLDKQQIDIEVHFDKLNLKGDYDVAAKIVVPVKARGPVEIDAMDITGKVVLKYRLVPSKRGQRLFFYEMTLKLSIRDYTSKFKPTTGPDVTFGDAINAVLNQNRQEIIDGIRPSLEKSISAHILQIANRICKNFTFDELFPDRE